MFLHSSAVCGCFPPTKQAVTTEMPWPAKAEIFLSFPYSKRSPDTGVLPCTFSPGWPGAASQPCAPSPGCPDTDMQPCAFSPGWLEANMQSCTCSPGCSCVSLSLPCGK